MDEKDILFNKATEARNKYVAGYISKEEALKDINPYIEFFNKKSAEIAKKYGRRPQKLNVNYFMRANTLGNGRR